MIFGVFWWFKSERRWAVFSAYESAEWFWREVENATMREVSYEDVANLARDDGRVRGLGGKDLWPEKCSMRT